MSDTPQRIWITGSGEWYRAGAGVEYIRADLLRELVTAVRKLDEGGWWTASESAFQDVRDAFGKAKKALRNE